MHFLSACPFFQLRKCAAAVEKKREKQIPAENLNSHLCATVTWKWAKFRSILWPILTSIDMEHYTNLMLISEVSK